MIKCKCLNPTYSRSQTIAPSCDLSTIRQDSEGRFCLNDLHKAAGGATKDRPAEWLKVKATADLAAQLRLEGIPSIYAQAGVGTFVPKELVYAYAMWVSPAFHLKVIRFFDRGVKDGVAVADHAASDLLENPFPSSSSTTTTSAW